MQLFITDSLLLHRVINPRRDVSSWMKLGSQPEVPLWSCLHLSLLESASLVPGAHGWETGSQNAQLYPPAFEGTPIMAKN